MSEYLELTADKFTFKVARDRLYTSEGVWVLPLEGEEASKVRLGLSDYLQQHSGDVAFVNLKPVGTVLAAGDEFAEAETIKVNVGLPSPIRGSILETNKALEINPEFVNQDPYGKGWLITLTPAEWDDARAALLDANAYLEVMRTQIDEELKEAK